MDCPVGQSSARRVGGARADEAAETALPTS
jgi:hypothetical protein